MIRRLLFLVATIAIGGLFAQQVIDAETLIRDGDTVLLELAPADPRSLIQGDYMALAWSVERKLLDPLDGPATLILALDARRIVQSGRLDDGSVLTPGEHRFAVARHPRTGSIAIEPHSFLFEEGSSALYAKARYGIFKVDRGGRHLLAGLADTEAKPIATAK